MKFPVIALLFLITACNLAPDTTVTPTLRQMPTATPLPSISSIPTNTPPPLPTLPPTPAPVVYTIQKGDTLIAIATKFDITLEAIDKLNPKLDPAKLQTGQTILLPPEVQGVAATAIPLPALTPIPISLDPFYCYPTPSSSVICVGEFKNTTNTPIVNLSVQVNLLKPDNSSGANVIAYSPLDMIPVGVTVPLAATFPQAVLSSNRGANSAVLTAESAAAVADKFVMLTVSGAAGAASPNGFTISGSVVNPSNAEVKSIAVIATVYNSNGIINYREINLPGSLTAKGSTPFSIVMTGITEATRWAVIAQARTK